MRLTPRVLALPLLLGAGLLASCDAPTKLPTKGRIVPRFALVTDTKSTAKLVALDGMRATLTLSGSSSIVTTENLTPPTTPTGNWTGTLDAIEPGSYTLTLEGTVGGAIQHYARSTSAITVTAGGTTPVVLQVAPVVPTVPTFTLSDTTDFSRTVTLGTSFALATGWQFEVADNAGFTNAIAGSATSTTFPVTVPDVGTWFIRVRPTLPFTSFSQVVWSDAQTFTVTASSGGRNSANAIGATLVSGVPDTIVDRNITPTLTEGWYVFPARAGDSLFVTTRAAGLTPPSPLNTTVTIFRADGTTQLTTNDNISGTNTDSRDSTVAPATENYLVRVGRANSTVGHYDLVLELRRLPAVPSGLSVIATSATGARVRWTDNADNETSYRIERCLGAACTDFAEQTAGAANDTSFTDTGLTAGATYRYRVRARNGVGNSAFIGPVSVTLSGPTAPTGLTATMISGSRIDLAWTDASDNETAFEIERCSNGVCASDGDFTAVASVPAGTEAYSNTGLAVDGTYTYRVRATNNVAPSAFSATATANTIRPAAPSALVATTVSATQIDLVWHDNTAIETGFSVQRCSGQGCSTFTEIGTTTPDDTTYTDATALPETFYTYRVFAANLAGNSASPSNSALANTRSPGVPASFAASVVSATRVDLSWSDTTAAETGFAIERCVGTNCAVFSALATVAAGSTGYSDLTVVVDSSYRYRIRATGVAGNSAEAGPVLASLILPNAPSGLAAATVSGTQVNLTWTDASDNESSFRIERCAGAGCSNFVEVGSAAAGTPSYSDVGVTVGNDYQYRIRARNAVGNSGASNTAAASTRAAAAPTALTATLVSGTQVNLAWTDQSDNETDFRIERCTGVGCSNFTTLATVAAGVVTYQNTGVTAGLSYSYRVLAINAVGASAASNTATATTAVPAAPTGLAATLFSDSRIDLTWTDASSDEQGFVVERCEGAGCVNFVAIGTPLAAGVVGYQDAGVAPGLDYRYRVRAFNVVGSSAFSSIVATSTRPPSAPTGLNAITVSGSRIDLNWTDAADNEAGFVIERCAGTGCTSVDVDTVAANVTSYSDTTAPLDASMIYRVRAINAAGASAVSNDAAANTLLPIAPSGLTATTTSATSIALDWTNNAPDANGFVIDRCLGSGCAEFAAIDSTAGGVTSFTDATVSVGNVYSYLVRARNISGRSTPSPIAEASTVLPAAPTALLAETRSDTRIDLTWTDNAVDELGFYVERCTGAACVDFVIVDSTATDITGYVNEGLTASLTYRYRVRAFNAAGGSAYTDIAAASTNLPAIPTDLAASPQSTTEVGLTWTDNSTDEIGFLIEHCVGDGCLDFVEVANVADATVAFLHTGASAGAVNRYRIRAFNGAGNSGYSNVASVTTTIPVAPAGVTATPNGTTSVDIAWTDVSDNETRFVIERCTGAGCGAFAAIDSVASGTSNYNDATVSAGATYRYRVFARNAIGNSTPSNEVEVSTLLPADPTNLVAVTFSSTRIDLTWDDNASNEDGYELERCTGASCTDFARIDSLAPNTASYSDAGLTPNLAFRYRVRAINGVGASAYTAIADATTNVPADPTGLVATAASTSSISLVWVDNADNETSYVIQRCNAASCLDGDFTDIAAVGSNVATYVDATLALNDIATYRVRAVNDNGASRYTNTATASVTIPAAPTAFAAANTQANRITIGWSDDATNEVSYQLERCTGTGCADFALLVTLPANTTAHVDSATVLDETYSYRVRAVNLVGESPYAGTASANTIRPSAPTGLAATTVSATQVDLGWADNASNELGYTVERCTGDGCTDFALLVTTGGDIAGYSDLTTVVGQTYRYRVTAFNLAGTSGTDGPVDASTLLPANPTDLAAIVTAPNEITLGWTDNANNELTYRLERCAGAGCAAFVQIATIAQDVTSYADGGLVSNTFYRYRLRAANSAGFSAYTAIVSPNTFAPAPPTALASTTVLGDRIDLTWTDAASNETGFRIERCTGAGCADFVEVATVAANATGHADSTLAFGTTYRYRVRSYNGVANSAYSDIVEENTNVPLDPSALTAAAQSTTRIDLAWTDNGTNETGYRVERCAGPGCADFAVVATLAADATTYSDTPIAEATSFTYRVRAFNEGSSGYSNTATATTILPAAPTGPSATAVAGDRVDLEWVDASDNEQGFQIERCAGAACGDFALVTTTAADATTYSDIGLTGGLVYRYRIRAVNGAGTSAYTGIVQSATVVPGIPTTLTATTFSADRIDLSWIDNAGDELGFVIERCTGSGCGAFTPIDSVETPNATSFQNTGLTAGTTYRYRVRAYNASGTSGASNVATAGTNTPAAPSGLAAVTIAAGRIDLTWTENADNEVSLRVERCDGPGCTTFVEIASLGIDAASYSDLTTVVNTTYRYRVRAVNNAGSSAYSDIADVDTDVPATPTTLVATTISATRIDLTWVDAADNEVSYRVERCVGAGCSEFTEVATLAVDAQGYTDEPLTPNESYSYRVRAVNAAGTSGYTAEVTATTSIPQDPTGLVATTISANRIDLSWTDNSGNELAFIVQRCADPSCASPVTLATLGANVTSYSDETATVGNLYGYRVLAQNAAGTSAPATTTGSTLLPADPVASAVVISGATRITIDWTDASDNEDAFVIERCRDVDCTDFAPLTTLAAGTTTYEDTGLDGGVSYSYRIRADNAAGSSAPSATLTTVLVAPDAPSKLNAVTLSATQAQLDWLDNATNETGFRILRCRGAGCVDLAVIDSVAANVNVYQTNDLDFDNSYTFAVTAINPVGESVASDPATTTTALAEAATGLVATVASQNQIDLTWTDNSSIEDGFLVERCVGVGCTEFEQILVTSADVTAIADGAVSLNNVYTYRVRPYNAVGPSVYSNDATETTLQPATPTLVTATPITVSQIDLTWTDNADNETFNVVDQCAGVGCTNFSVVAVLGPDITSYSWTGATPNTSHRVRVRTFRSNIGFSAGSSASADLSTVLNVPTMTSVQVYDRNRVDLVWTDNSTIETGYQVVACFGVACVPSVLLGTLPANTTTFSWSGLAAGASYSWSVRAISGATQSALTPAGGVWMPAVMSSGSTAVVSDTASAQRHYVINVPAATPELRVTITGGTGDADLYVRQGLAATLTAFNCRPFIGGNTETCIIPNPAAGDWFVMVRGFNAFDGVTVKTSLATRYGYPTAFAGTNSWAANYMLGQQVVVSQPITLTHIGFNVVSGTGGVRIGIYTNNFANNPGALVTQVAGTVSTTGNVEFPTSAVALPAGTYWLMFNFATSIIRTADLASSIPTIYTPFAYGPALPIVVPTPYTNTTSYAMNSWIRGYP